MKFNEMNELKLKDWNGKPFEAYRCDNCCHICDGVTAKIVGYINGNWVTINGNEWLHVYPVEDNKPKRMTNRQLAMWLAKGNGQMLFASHTDLSIELGATTLISHAYNLCYDEDECSDRVRVRKWGSKEWIEPTVDLL